MPFRTLNRDSFAERFIDAGRRDGFFGPGRAKKTMFSGSGSSSVGRLCLDNAYEEYLSAPLWKRHSVFGRLVREFGAYESHQTLDKGLTRAQLMPHVKERMALAQIELTAGQSETGPVPVYREMAQHLALEVVFDRGGAMLPASDADLADLGLTFDEALDIANRNLLQRGQTRFQSPRPGLHISACRDRYDASRLHLPDVVPNLPVRGRPVAMTPNRDMLIVTGANDTVGLRMMAELAAGAFHRSRPMNGYAYRLDARWTPWLPDTGHSSYDLFKRLAVESDAAYYAEQLEYKEAIRAREGKDVALPAVKVQCDYVNDAWTSQTTWVLGRPCLLPKADSILVQQEINGSLKPMGIIEWETLQAEAPNSMKPTGLYPERYRMDVDTPLLDLVRIGLKSAD